MPMKRPTYKPRHKMLQASASAAYTPRLSPSKRGYGWNWQKLRAIRLALQPLCEDCKGEGRITSATEVDHIDGDIGNLDDGNFRSLCKSCHSSKTVRCNGGLGRART